MKLLIILAMFSSYSFAYEIVAHRGVHQNYHRDGLTNTTCTASRISKSDHHYLENTIESIERAFNLGATMVELDVHPTTENSASDNLVVFHDWTLNCRTNVSCEDGCNCNDKDECVTHMQSWDYLKTLDLGHGYTFDNGNTYPFRGKYFGKMPLFEEVLRLLKKYETKKILVNVKGNKKRTARAFMRVIESYPLKVRERLYYPYKYGFKADLKRLGVENQIDQSDKECLLEYLKTGWYGHLPKECHNKRLFIPVRETLERFIGRPGRYVKLTSILWGWPEKFIKLAHMNGTKVFASQVDSSKEYGEMEKLDLDGIMTNKIEVIGPLLRGQ